jgi:hypothetical protein
MKVNALLVVVWGCLAGGVNAFAPELNVTTPPACAVCSPIENGNALADIHVAVMYSHICSQIL